MSIRIQKLDRQYIQNVDEFPVDRLVYAYRLVERNIDYLIILDSYHYITLSVLKSIDSSNSQTTCQNAVLRRRDTAALEVTENGDASLEFRIFMHKTVCIILGAAGTVLLAL